MAYPARASQVPPNVAWFELNTGKPLPMFARYLAYLDAALQAIIAAATLPTPALVQTQRVSLQLMQVQLVQMNNKGEAADPFARYVNYVDTCLRRLIAYANAHSVTTPILFTQVPPVLGITDTNTGLPSADLADYFDNVDRVMQRMIAAGV